MSADTLDQTTVEQIKASLPKVTPRLSIEKAVWIWTVKAELAQTLDDVYEVGASMADYGRPIRFDTKQETFGLWSGLFSTATFSYFMYSGHDIYGFLTALAEAYTGIDRQWFGWGVPAVFALITLFWWRRRSNKEHKISYLADTLANKVAMFQYGLKEVDAAVVGRHINAFGELRRGNHERYIRNAHQGRHQGRNWSFVYEAYRLHYVDEEVVRTTGPDNEERTERRYHHYDRSGIMLPFPWVKGIHLCKGFETTLYPAPYTPASMQFNNHLHCRGVDDMTLARLLTPKMVERLTRAAQEIPGLCIEVNQEGQMLIACSDREVVVLPEDTRGNKNHDPRITPAGFNEFLHYRFTMDRLDALLRLADDLAAPYTR
ncbi:MAG: hypothetical protein AWU57_304 [Marinobacter sp. T13-3]|nr:MAG: hypothetical protein AWU57_304 [Marinobacter sp. T13-3]